MTQFPEARVSNTGAMGVFNESPQISPRSRTLRGFRFTHHIRMTHRIAPLILAGIISASAFAAEWPEWRGPGGQGHASVKRPPPVWSETSSLRQFV